MDLFREKILVYEVNENGEIIERYMMDPYEINEAIDEGESIIQSRWQGKSLHNPTWNFEQREWVHGLTEEEIQQRERERIEQENRPPELELLKQENEMLRGRLGTAENAIISLLEFL